MSWDQRVCPACRTKNAVNRDACYACGATLDGSLRGGLQSADIATEPDPAAAGSAAHAPTPVGGSMVICVAVGLFFLVSGFALLFLWPGEADLPVVNLQKLMIGQALFISGSVLLAAALRPR